MKRLLSPTELRKVLERGLLTGKWSVLEFNVGAVEPVLPSGEFLEENPAFTNMNFRDLDAFKVIHREDSRWNGLI
jgi:hypothetical protein